MKRGLRFFAPRFVSVRERQRGSPISPHRMAGLNSTGADEVMRKMCMPLAQSWVDVFTCIAVCFAGYLSIRQWRNTLKIQRAKFLSELVAKLHSKEFLLVVYLFDYDCDWYNESFHNSTKNKDRNDSDESQVDNYLSWLAYLCHLFSTDLLATVSQ